MQKKIKGEKKNYTKFVKKVRLRLENIHFVHERTARQSAFSMIRTYDSAINICSELAPAIFFSMLLLIKEPSP